MITVKYIGLYSDLAGITEEKLEIPAEGTTARQLAIELCERFGPEFEHVVFESNRSGWSCAMFINGRAASMKSPIQDGNVITITYQLEGGD
ncbi:MAG: hypothetical protein E7328_06410 [Clostridiales bacterium]|nr:hypothetical protein [Clostridiales bacterium]